MNLFLREHIPFICFSIIQLFVVLTVYWLDGYNHLSTALYSVFLGGCFLIAFLLYRYFSHRRFYNKLSNPSETLEDSLEELDSTPLSVALQRVLKTQYSQYHTWEYKQKEHLTFINQWVHQMKTPLSVIELITQEENGEVFESIVEEVDQMQYGLEMVLYMARLQTFEQDFYVERVSLQEIVQEVIRENKRLFIRSYVYPEVKVKQTIMVETDRKWLRFVIHQVISNAIKYSAGSRKNVTITTLEEERSVILEIHDHGVGIPKEDLPRVFRPFYTGINGRKFKESTGMGLYLVKNIIKRLEHDIEIKSEVGKGTTICIIFPYANR
ncbi:HAMP domain-containing sensor histidine kinase [Bacillus sp. FDAARGOS_1420]|uniref:sensor histidine kinase n=1 Tax=unclassified Bacillus (in: firmicutes) TaxID=185979 RepID=UPI001C5B4262|nr:sensor histidine kinase [Bacillus sp. FDAARGOS_1420]MBW3494024.1 sensor histidine kinase [Bacillus sp. FDAARGOS_1420]